MFGDMTVEPEDAASYEICVDCSMYRRLTCYECGRDVMVWHSFCEHGGKQETLHGCRGHYEAVEFPEHWELETTGIEASGDWAAHLPLHKHGLI